MSVPPFPDREAVLAEIRAFVAQWFRDGREDGLAPDAPLVTSGIVDSAGVVDIADFLERRFGVRVQDVDISLENCNTIAGWTDLVLQRR